MLAPTGPSQFDADEQAKIAANKAVAPQEPAAACEIVGEEPFPTATRARRFS